VNIEVKRSQVHGSGVFATEPISAGTKVWQFDPSMHVCDRWSLAKLAPSALSQALHAGYVHEPSGLFVWYADGMQFMNHGDRGQANVGLDYWPELEDDHVVALRDIAPGEELLENYHLCLRAGLAPDHWLTPFYRAFNPEHYHFLLALLGAEEPAYPVVAFPAAGGAKRRTVATSASRNTGLERTAANPDAKQAA
jgi:hypothetical protein